MMAHENTRLIISQRYIQKNNGTRASLVDINGNSALVATEKGKLERVNVEKFKHLYRMAFTV